MRMAAIATQWNDDARDSTLRWLRLCNEYIQKAIEAMAAGDYETAGDRIRDAMWAKLEAVQAFPPVLTDEFGHSQRFDMIYTRLFDIDILASHANGRAATEKGATNPPRGLVAKLAEELREARDRLKALGLDDPATADAECVQKTENLLSTIDDLLKLLDGFDPAAPFDFKELDLLIATLRAAKKELLDDLANGYGISLWDAYVLFYEIDRLLVDALNMAAASAADGSPPDARKNRLVRGILRHAHELKEKLEHFIDGTPAPPKPPGAHGTPGDPPPKPDYPPGSEDLPPFPPPDHA